MFAAKRPNANLAEPALIFPVSHWNDMNIVIVESPAKAKTINKYLGSTYEVLASFGHVRDLSAKNASVDPEANFPMIWEIAPKTAGRLNATAGAVALIARGALRRPRAIGGAAAGMRPRTRDREIYPARILVAGRDLDDAAWRRIRSAAGRGRRQEDSAARHRHRRGGRRFQ